MRKNLSVCTRLRANWIRCGSGLELPGRLNGPLQALDPHVSDNRTLQPVSGVLVYAGPLRELRNAGVNLAYNTLK
jgi:hypothetical protein